MKTFREYLAEASSKRYYVHDHNNEQTGSDAGYDTKKEAETDAAALEDNVGRPHRVVYKKVK